MPLNPNAPTFILNTSAPVFIPGVPYVPEPCPAAPEATDLDRDSSKLMLDLQTTNHDPTTASPKTPTTPTFNARMHEIHGTPKAEPTSRALPRIDSGRALNHLEAEDTEEDFLDAPCMVGELSDVNKSISLSPREMWNEDKPHRPELIWAANAPASSEGDSEEDKIRRDLEEEEEGAAAENGSGRTEDAEEEKDEGGAGKEQGSKGDSDASASETVTECRVSQRARVTVDDFEILHMIGEGGFGKVYQVEKKSSGKVYAMKAMRKEVVIKDNLRGTKAERSIMSSVRHPYIVNMHYAFQCKGRLYLIMDYFPGGQFLDMLVTYSPFDQEAYTLYTAEIMLALSELHARGIVHRDLKPENILVDGQGHLVVTDFGCSKMPEEAGSPVRTRSWAGTELYMAPEQLQKQQYGQEVDWWALGALAWEMVTGDNPFYHKNRKAIHNNILKKKLALPSFLPKEVHSFVKGLLTRDPAKRLGARGTAEVRDHPFFKTLSMPDVLARHVAAPLRSSADAENPLDVSAHNERYTKAKACLSPLLSPMIAHDDHFAGFSWAADDTLVLPPAAMIAARRASRMSVNIAPTEEEGAGEREEGTEEEEGAGCDGAEQDEGAARKADGSAEGEEGNMEVGDGHLSGVASGFGVAAEIGLPVTAAPAIVTMPSSMVAAVH